LGLHGRVEVPIGRGRRPSPSRHCAGWRAFRDDRSLSLPPACATLGSLTVRASGAVGHREPSCTQSRGQRLEFAAIEFPALGVSVPHYGSSSAAEPALSSFPHTRANAGWMRLWAADSATNATTPPRIASDLKPTAGFRSMSSQMAISGEPTAVVPAALAGVFDGGGVSSDRKFAMSGRSKGVALASGVKCRGYGVRSAA
jgi:hypothetical protein